MGLQPCGTTHRDGFHGTLVLGGVNHSLHRGEIKYTPIIGEGLYFVNVTAIGTSSGPMMVLNPTSIRKKPPMLNISDDAFQYFQMENSRFPEFYVDSGNPYLYLGAAYHTVKESINNAASDLGLGDVFPGRESPSCVKAADLDAFPDIIIRLQGDVTLRVPPSKYFQAQRNTDCLWLFIAPEVGGTSVLGTPVLETYYTVFDKANKRLGFAPIAGCD